MNKKKQASPKVLIVTSVASMIDQFNMTNIKILQSLGCKVEVACNFETGNTSSKERINLLKNRLKGQDIVFYQIDFDRCAYHLFDNFRAYKQLKNILKKKELNYAFVHCQSPIGGFITRLIAKKEIKIIYTAHGFHFYHGAPVINWLIYYPIERYLARYTDILITINTEDYRTAKKFKAESVQYVPGVGICISKFANNTPAIEGFKKELGIPAEAKIVLSVGELNNNKNHQIIIKALSKLQELSITYIICGEGTLKEALQNEAIKQNVRLLCLGYRSDLDKIYKLADVFTFPSKREGLSVALMEAMASGLPIVCSRIRGNVDLIKENENGIFCNTAEEYAEAIKTLLTDSSVSCRMSCQSMKRIQNFDISYTKAAMEDIYKGLI